MSKKVHYREPEEKRSEEGTEESNRPPKKEAAMLKGQLAQLQKDLGGIKEMKGEPVQSIQ